MPPMHQRQPIALPQVGSHFSVQLVIVEQPIQGLEHRIGLSRYFRHSRKDVFWVIAIYEHACSLLR